MGKELFLRIKDFMFLTALMKVLLFVYPQREYTKQTLAIVKLDGIGDYILFRNLLTDIKQSDQYRDYNLILIGSPAWKDLAEHFDHDTIKQFVWVDRPKFQSHLLYAIKVAVKILRLRPEITLHASYTRDTVSAVVSKLTRSEVLIGNAGGTPNMRPYQRSITDKYYTKLINTGETTQFEFNRNKIFLYCALGITSASLKPFFDKKLIPNNFQFNQRFAVLFPGAGHKNRRWQIEKFAEIADYIFKTYRLEIFVSGSKDDNKYYIEIARQTKQATVRDMTGHSLPAFIEILSKSTILVTNDTSAAHMGAATECRIISLLNGRHFGRFSPYPKEWNLSFIAVYPPKIMGRVKTDYDVLCEVYKNKTNLNIGDIPTDEVKKRIDYLLNESNVTS
jgi:ADP-heptose:LPS heptosyltransferase